MCITEKHSCSNICGGAGSVQGQLVFCRAWLGLKAGAWAQPGRAWASISGSGVICGTEIFLFKNIQKLHNQIVAVYWQLFLMLT
jgi:hypothetical protein